MGSFLKIIKPNLASKKPELFNYRNPCSWIILVCVHFEMLYILKQFNWYLLSTFACWKMIILPRWLVFPTVKVFHWYLTLSDCCKSTVIWTSINGIRIWYLLIVRMLRSLKFPIQYNIMFKYNGAISEKVLLALFVKNWKENFCNARAKNYLLWRSFELGFYSWQDNLTVDASQ